MGHEKPVAAGGNAREAKAAVLSCTGESYQAGVAGQDGYYRQGTVFFLYAIANTALDGLTEAGQTG